LKNFLFFLKSLILGWTVLKEGRCQRFIFGIIWLFPKNFKRDYKN